MSICGAQAREGNVYRTLRVTPAMAAGVTERVWVLEELLATGPKGMAR